jgi:hypothetical protein
VGPGLKPALEKAVKPQIKPVRFFSYSEAAVSKEILKQFYCL